tara:strand:- start:149653 stop:150000 length:348 start_codon:yes stop_codon:yes gene_type:complete
MTPLFGLALLFLLLELVLPILLFDLLFVEGETLLCGVLFLSVLAFTALRAERVEGVLLFLKASDRTFELLGETTVDDLLFEGLADAARVLLYSLAFTYLLGLTLAPFLEEDLVET